MMVGRVMKMETMAVKEMTKTILVKMLTLVLGQLTRHDSINPSLVSHQSDQTGAKPSLGFFYS